MENVSENLTLVVLAGGLGSRFGGDKQIATLPKLERTMMELSIEDAFLAGVRHVVLVINAKVRQELEATILPRLPEALKVELVEQSVLNVPQSFRGIAQDRTKPWGTGHALLCAKPLIREGAIVVTADDYYGPGAYRQLVEHFQSDNNANMAMVGYPIANTLSEEGGVNRGICELESDKLKKVSEFLNIRKELSGLIGALNGQDTQIDDSKLASMTFWGVTPTLLDKLSENFEKFLENYDSDVKKEYYLPDCIQACIDEQLLDVDVYVAREHWYGITFKQELTSVAGKIYEHRQG